MAKTKQKKEKTTSPNKQENPLLNKLMDHYGKGTEDMEKRKTRKGKGWDAVFDALMNKLPDNWPYTSKVTDPRIRTTLLEKTARLLNSKLQGRLVPREGGDAIKARINNSLLDYQWDAADVGGSMIEKVAKADTIARITGAAFALTYWDVEKNSNEMKVLDPRDVFPDYTADHIRNARWCQVREYTTLDKLEALYPDNVARIRSRLQEKQSVDVQQHSQVKQNRGIEERMGKDPANPVVELVTEYTAKVGDQKAMRHVFLPRYNEVLESGPCPYKHERIPISMLRYYPLGDDMYGESEVEPVMSLQRAINAVLCGFIDTMNLAMRPPIKLISGETRMDTVVFNPGARWILNNIQSGQEVQIGTTAIQAFNNTYPALVAAFNTAMGDQSLGTSNLGGGGFEKKTATEVASLERQENSRDQYNQLYLSQFLKDVMMLWLSNNQQYLFDDPTKKYHILRIVGREAIRDLQKLELDSLEMPQEAMNEIAGVVTSNAGAVSSLHLEEIMQGVQVPKNAVIKNPTESPENYEIVNKLEVKDNGNEAELYMTPDDMVGMYDYVPDVKSMAAGAGIMMQNARKEALQSVKEFREDLMAEGQRLKVSELLTNVLEDAGYKDAESLFESIEAGQAALGGGQLLGGALPEQGVPVPPGVSLSSGGPGMAQPAPVQA